MKEKKFSTDSTLFEYGGAKQRVLKTGVSTGSTLYIHGLGEYPLMEKTTSGTELMYVYGHTGLLSILEDTTKYFVLKDHLGSTRVVLRGADNTPISWYDYDPFGTMWRATESYQAKYKFTGQEYDVATALHNFHARFYDSDLGQFYAMDPAGQGFSPYAYCGNNPVNSIDPTGKETKWYNDNYDFIKEAEHAHWLAEWNFLSHIGPRNSGNGLNVFVSIDESSPYYAQLMMWSKEMEYAGKIVKYDHDIKYSLKQFVKEVLSKDKLIADALKKYDGKYNIEEASNTNLTTNLILIKNDDSYSLYDDKHKIFLSGATWWDGEIAQIRISPSALQGSPIWLAVTIDHELVHAWEDLSNDNHQSNENFPYYHSLEFLNNWYGTDEYYQIRQYLRYLQDRYVPGSRING